MLYIFYRCSFSKGIALLVIVWYNLSITNRYSLSTDPPKPDEVNHHTVTGDARDFSNWVPETPAADGSDTEKSE